MISLEEQKQAIGCDDEAADALGGALGVPLMAVPSIGLTGDQFILNFKVINVDDAKVLVRHGSVRKEVDLPRVLTLTDGTQSAVWRGRHETAQPSAAAPHHAPLSSVLGVGAIGR